VPEKRYLERDVPKWICRESTSIRAELRRLTHYPDMLRDEGGGRFLDLESATRYLLGYVTTNPKLGGQLVTLLKDLKLYRKRSDYHRPYVSLLVAAPGAGKTTLARQLAEAAGYQFYEVNVSRLQNTAALLAHFDQVASLSAARKNEKLTLLFLDEIDARLEGKRVFGMLLSALLEGVYEVGALKRHLGKVAVVLASSQKPTCASFHKWLITCREEKGPDLWSRINGQKLELPEMNAAERVYLAASLLKNKFPGITHVSKELLDVFAGMAHAAPREIEQQVDRIERAGGEVRLADLTGKLPTQPETMIRI
jgi:hypothetical protein